MRSISLFVAALPISTPAHAQCIQCFNNCWFDQHGQTWCERLCHDPCAQYDVAYSHASGDPSGGLLVLFILSVIIAAIWGGASTDETTQIEAETLSLEELTRKVDAAAKEADAAIERMLKDAADAVHRDGDAP